MNGNLTPVPKMAKVYAQTRQTTDSLAIVIPRSVVRLMGIKEHDYIQFLHNKENGQIVFHRIPEESEVEG